MRRLALCTAICSLAGLASAQTYDIHIIDALNTFGIPECYATDVNSSGLVAGWMTNTWQDGGGNFHTEYFGYTWTPVGGVTLLTAGSGGLVNDSGDVLAAGILHYAGGGQSGVPGWHFGMNDNRMVVGTIVSRTYSGCRYDRYAHYWTPQTGTRSLVALGVPAAEIANDANDFDEIVGVRSITGVCADFEAFYFDAVTNQHIDIHALLNSSTGTTTAVAINEQRQILGEGTTFAGTRAWIHDLNSGGFTFLPGLDGGDTGDVRPHDINNHGHVVGHARTAASQWRGFLWTPDDGMRNLHTLVPDLPANFQIGTIYAIGDNGWIVGSGFFGTGSWGVPKGVVLIPRGSTCPADLSGASDPLDPAYGVADGLIDASDFFYYLDQFSAGNLAVADLSSSTDPADPGYGIPDGALDASDFFYYLDIFIAGCP